MDDTTALPLSQVSLLQGRCTRCEAPGGVYGSLEAGHAFYECPRCARQSALYAAAEEQLAALLEVAVRAWLPLWADEPKLQAALPELLEVAQDRVLRRLALHS